MSSAALLPALRAPRHPVVTTQPALRGHVQVVTQCLPHLTWRDAVGQRLHHSAVAERAHHVVAECVQALNDVGFSVAANASTYWVGEAMQGTDYNDLDETPEKTASTTKTLAANSVHLARLLRASPFPAA